MTDRVIDAYRLPRHLVEGCQHRLGCKCDPPYWLRASTPAEERHEELMLPGAIERVEESVS